MNTPNTVLMQSARETLKGKWRLAIKGLLVVFLISLVFQIVPLIGPIVSIFVSPAIMAGFFIFWLSFSRNQPTRLGQIFEGFDTWWRSFKAYWLMFIYTFLWLLLLIVPGLIAMYSYSQLFFILAHDRTIGANAAIDRSKEMMKGNKMKLFRLHLRFLGWWLLVFIIPAIIWGIGLFLGKSNSLPSEQLGILGIIFGITTLIGFIIAYFWLVPYIYVAMAKFYDDVKGEVTATPEIPEAIPVPQAI